MQGASAIRGRIVFEGEWPQPGSAPFSVAEPADGDPSRSGRERSDRAILRTNCSLKVWCLARTSCESARPTRGLSESIFANGRDVTRTPIDLSGSDVDDLVVTLTDKAALVSGTVRGTNGGPVGSGAVVVFPADDSGWTNYGMTPSRIKSILVTNVGGYRLPGLPAGEYLIVAVDESQLSAWQDPAWLKRAAAGATRISIGWGDSRTVDLVKQAGR